MSNIEHLIENALVATQECEDCYQAFTNAMSALYNQQMLQEVSMTMDELWEIVQYLRYTWFPTIEAEPVRHGRWKPWSPKILGMEYSCDTMECNLCGKTLHNARLFANYCPNCGAKMDVTDINVGNKEGD